MKRVLFILVNLLLLTSCAQRDAPQLIASYPIPLAIQPKGSNSYQVPVRYAAQLEMEVSDPATAAGQAEQMSKNYGGYLVSSNYWTVDGYENRSLILAVPIYNFNALKSALSGLGKVKTERIWSETEVTPGQDRGFTTISLYLLPKANRLPGLQIGQWNPTRTLEHAFQVFITIFGFIADMLIWVLVVTGPFALIGYLIWRFVSKNRPQSTLSQNSSIQSTNEENPQ